MKVGSYPIDRARPFFVTLSLCQDALMCGRLDSGSAGMNMTVRGGAGRLMEGDLRLAEASPALSRASADGRARSFSEPPDAGAASSKGARSEASAHGPTRTASATSELPLSSDSEVGPPARIASC